MNPSKEIADLLFPNVAHSVEEYLKKYPERKLPDGAQVTRFGPSPTGFLHIGGLFAALVSERIAHQSNGVFFLRIEDTDKKREVEDGISGITNALNQFRVTIDEGVISNTEEKGDYGPYKQSERAEIYQTFIKHLIEHGHAYPCFCTPEELEASRKEQEAQKIRPGYYGKWAVHRNDSVEDIKKNLEAGKGFVIRLKSQGSETVKTEFHDLVKGKITVVENDQDTVLYKSDGLPTYHFAHVVDDFLMRTTIVQRGDEWLASLPIHLELFKAFGWTAPAYAHISPIMKNDGGTKRKLSKRKDPEAAMSYYNEKGYVVEAIMEYLLNIANSAFEDWRKANPTLPNTDFIISLDKFSKSGALFDIDKLNFISKEVVSRMNAQDVYDETLMWAEQYNPEFAKRITKNKDFVIKVLSIERSVEKPRKDIAMWSEVPDQISYFFEDLFEDFCSKNSLAFPEHIDETLTKTILTEYAKIVDISGGRDEWFEKLRQFGENLGFARDMKTYKASSSAFKGHIGDVAMVLRLALTGRAKTPDLYEIMVVLGQETVAKRFIFSLSKFHV